MEYSIIAATIGSLCLSLMIIFDRLMMGDCYKNKSDHAWVVSSCVGSIFGLIATFLTWFIFATFTDLSLSSILSKLRDLWWPSGILLLVVGVINIQVMRHYFRLFIPDSQERVNETAIAMWLAAVPLFIFLSVFTLNSLGFTNGQLAGLEKANVSIWFGLLVVVSIFSMICFEKVSGGSEAFRLERVGEILKMIGCIVVYTILSSSVLRAEEMDTISALALQPFYWIGFAAGARYLLRKQNRNTFINSWSDISIYLVPIIVVEVIGMSVYYFEFFALSGADPTLVNLITGGHIVLVFVFSIALTKLRLQMEKNGETQRWYFGLSFTKDKLPLEKLTIQKFLWFVAVVLTLLIATWFA